MLCYRFFKRLFDVILSLVLSLLFSPLMLVITLLIFLRDGGNPFFLHTRVGQNGKRLRVLKFRTMKRHAQDICASLTEEQLTEYRLEYKLNDDPRLIGYKKKGDGRRCFGAILRRTSMDELPQLWFNVLLLGNMSLVGPRPEVRHYVNYWTPEQMHVLDVRPGITDPASIKFRNENELMEQAENPEDYYINVIMQEKIRLYLEYVKNASFWYDIKLIFQTFWVIVRE